MKIEDERKASAEIAGTIRSITAMVCLKCITNNENPHSCEGYDMLRALNCIKGMLAADEVKANAQLIAAAPEMAELITANIRTLSNMILCISRNSMPELKGILEAMLEANTIILRKTGG